KTLGRPVVALDLRRLPRGFQPLEAALIGLRRECRLRDALPGVADIDEGGQTEGDPAALLRVLARAIDDLPGPVVATASQHGLEVPVARSLARVRWTIPDTPTRRSIWVRALDADAESLAGELD